MRRLSPDQLDDLSASPRRPGYDRARLRVGMAHIGVGAFHRCHQAEYTDDALEAKFGDWGVVGINLRPPRLAETLAPQGGLYTRTLKQDDRVETRLVGSLLSTLDVEDAASAESAVATLASPSLSVVTMTLTEKGYCHIPATGALDFDNPDIRADARGGLPPRTALGLLTLALERRWATGAPPLSLLSCDNIPSNGDLLRSALIAFASTRSAELARWIEARVAFPCSMVDRIVPASTPADLDRVAYAFGWRDEAAVVGEPFRQWVVEDKFAGDRPPWDLAGVRFVADAKPYELIKMRVLNAAQSNLSHLGALVGHEYSFQAAADPTLAALTRSMLERETLTTLPRLEGMAATLYIETSFARIRNTAIQHRCHQIGTDGSQKIVQRLLNPLRERLAAGQDARGLTLAVAAWIAYCLAGANRFGRRWTPSDPHASTLIAIGDRRGEDFIGLATASLGIAAIFGVDLARPALIADVAGHLAGLLSHAPAAYLAERLGYG
jgi:fructuronate reductase